MTTPPTMRFGKYAIHWRESAGLAHLFVSRENAGAEVRFLIRATNENEDTRWSPAVLPKGVEACLLPFETPGGDDLKVYILPAPDEDEAFLGRLVEDANQVYLVAHFRCEPDGAQSAEFPVNQGFGGQAGPQGDETADTHQPRVAFAYGGDPEAPKFGDCHLPQPKPVPESGRDANKWRLDIHLAHRPEVYVFPADGQAFDTLHPDHENAFDDMVAISTLLHIRSKSPQDAHQDLFETQRKLPPSGYSRLTDYVDIGDLLWVGIPDEHRPAEGAVFGEGSEFAWLRDCVGHFTPLAIENDAINALNFNQRVRERIRSIQTAVDRIKKASELKLPDLRVLGYYEASREARGAFSVLDYACLAPIAGGQRVDAEVWAHHATDRSAVLAMIARQQFTAEAFSPDFTSPATRLLAAAALTENLKLSRQFLGQLAGRLTSAALDRVVLEHVFLQEASSIEDVMSILTAAAGQGSRRGEIRPERFSVMAKVARAIFQRLESLDAPALLTRFGDWAPADPAHFNKNRLKDLADADYRALGRVLWTLRDTLEARCLNRPEAIKAAAKILLEPPPDHGADVTEIFEQRLENELQDIEVLLAQFYNHLIERFKGYRTFAFNGLNDQLRALRPNLAKETAPALAEILRRSGLANASEATPVIAERVAAKFADNDGQASQLLLYIHDQSEILMSAQGVAGNDKRQLALRNAHLDGVAPLLKAFNGLIVPD